MFTSESDIINDQGGRKYIPNWRSFICVFINDFILWLVISPNFEAILNALVNLEFINSQLFQNTLWAFLSEVKF